MIISQIDGNKYEINGIRYTRVCVVDPQLEPGEIYIVGPTANDHYLFIPIVPSSTK